MAAVTYFPSIHDETTGDTTMWAPFYLKSKQLSSRVTSAAGSSSNSRTDGDDRNSSTTQQVGAPAARTTSGGLLVSDYQPLEAFCATAEDPGPGSWSEDDEICELLIRLKEMELCSMIGESRGLPQYTYLRNIRYCRMKQRRKRK
ncbi:uncharacterized protein C11orf91 homolog [Anabas testudineus]|uniref:uncharacterized protein C11orf91 homolog n=1 Tax=Anabas testudineus TaxID=64144 RepID=UPI000E45ACCA|nr:uncharacterized protein C11orf91 homolog [Anabas testudineus]